MKFFLKVLIAGGAWLLFVLLASTNQVSPIKAQGPIGQGPDIQSPFVGEPVTPKVSQEVRRLPAVPVHQLSEPIHEVNPRQRASFEPDDTYDEAPTRDPLAQNITSSLLRTPAVITSFEGISFVTGGAGVPPDPVGDVGPNHYVQMVNSTFAIYNKSGTLLAGPTNINELWNGAGGLCEVNNHGDPIVLYDPLADRWLLSQFAVPGSTFAECIAISQTPDPTGAYYLYEFTITDFFPDYPKLGVWPDAYYMTTNEDIAPIGRVGIYAFDRINMLAGNSATFQKFLVTGQNFMLPSDLDGSIPPPAGSPNYFYTFMDGTFWAAGGSDRLEIWEFDVDFATPANSVFTRTQNILIAPFVYTVCNYFIFNCIRQPAPGERVDAVSEWPMWRFAYRNLGSYEALVGNFTVDVGSNQAGIRWFELRKSGSNPWSLQQEGTHAPDSNSRWMGSIAMDRSGNIALGYSVSSNVLTPSLRYATRLATDPPGTLQSEVTLITGGGVQANGFNRWGDYSSMNVDPTDDCTFWYTGEYYGATSEAAWQTHIGKFKIPSCGIVSIYLPLILKDSITTPDLVVDSIVATSQAITVTIKNIGVAAVTDAFWVDVYINPNPAPTEVNQHWHNLASQGLVWGVTTPIPANGGTLTLTLGDAYYRPDYSRFLPPLPVGTPIYAQVDSVNLTTSYGGVLESHEISGGIYNNINSTISTASLVGPATPAGDEQPFAISDDLPPRR